MSMMNVFNIAASALNAQSMRLNTTASNMANVDSVAGPDGQAYRAKQVVFEAVPMGSTGQGVKVQQVVESAAAWALDLKDGEFSGAQLPGASTASDFIHCKPIT